MAAIRALHSGRDESGQGAANRTGRNRLSSETDERSAFPAHRSTAAAATAAIATAATAAAATTTTTTTAIAIAAGRPGRGGSERRSIPLS